MIRKRFNFSEIHPSGKLCVNLHQVAVNGTLCASDFWPNLNFPLEH